MIFKQYRIGDELVSNNYLLIDKESKEAVLIDCTGDFEAVNKDLEENSAKLKYILLTHGHFDHVLACSEFKKKLNPIIVLHKDDLILIDNLKIQCGYFGIPTPEKPVIDEFIDENSELKFGNHKIKIFHTKGHTKGSLSYLIDDTLFSGDTLFYEAVGRCDLPGGDFDELTESIVNKLYKLKPTTPVWPGHGRETTIEHELEYNFYVGKNSRSY